MDENDDEIKATPRELVFITAHAEALWSVDQHDDLAGFLADMRVLGFAIWQTPRVIFVFTGEE